MAKPVDERRLDSVAARSRLAVSGKPHWRVIGADLHLGYRRGKSCGKWVVRRHVGPNKYETETIANADDRAPSDGAAVLNYNQAQGRAREIAAKAKGQAAAPKGPLTVALAMASYFERLEQEHSKSLADARGRARLHILPALGEIVVSDLTRDVLSKWFTELARNAKSGQDGEAARKSRASANRVLTILRAGLNQAFRDGHTESDVAWRAIKPFRGVDAPRLRYFSKDELTRLINSAQGDFRSLVLGALYTGCRYGEICRLRVADFNADAGTVFVSQSKSGKARHVVLTGEGRKFFEVLAAGRKGDVILFCRDDGEPWAASHQIRRMAEACRSARITPVASFHILRHSAASHMVMAGVPLQVVAHNLGHADTRMTERHYAHLAPSYVAETIRRLTPTFGADDETNLVPLGSRR
jgi:integrase